MQTAHPCLVVAEQCSHRAKAFPVSRAAPPERRLGVHKEPGGDTARTADPSWPKGGPTA